MANIIIDGKNCTSVKEAIEKMMNLYDISRDNAICYLINDMNFTDVAAIDRFVTEVENLEEVSENIFCEKYIEIYLSIPEAEDIRYKLGDSVYPISGICELMCY